MTNFMDNFSFYGILSNGADIKIILIDGELKYSSLNKQILKFTNKVSLLILIDDLFYLCINFLA